MKFQFQTNLEKFFITIYTQVNVNPCLPYPRTMWELQTSCFASELIHKLARDPRIVQSFRSQTNV